MSDKFPLSFRRIQRPFGMGGVRAPLANLIDSDKAVVDACSKQIQDAIAKYC